MERWGSGNKPCMAHCMITKSHAKDVKVLLTERMV